MTSVSETKNDLRKQALRQRDAFSEENRIEKSLQACDVGLTLSIFDEDRLIPGTIVAGFHPIRSEIDPRPLMFALSRRHVRLCLPVVIDKETIVFRELNREAPLVKTGFGTVGPDENAEVLDPDVLLVPLSVFDRQGGRIGYGAGYYDRAVEKLELKGRKPLLVGMAFSLQEAPSVPTEPHDRPLHHVITENGTLDCTRHSA